MSLLVEKHRHSIQDYYRIENDATEKHEFRDGEILAMSGGSPAHAKIAMNVAAVMWQRLKGKPCQPYGSDLRVRITARQRTAYPDVSVICGPIQLDPDDPSGHTVLNPRVIAEVLSPSTEAYDRGNKFAAYREIPSLSEYVLVSQSEPRVETFLRQPDGTWSLASHTGIDAVAKVRAVDVDLPLSEVFAGVEFPSEPPAQPVA